MIKTREDLKVAQALYDERDHVVHMLEQANKFDVGVECCITTGAKHFTYATVIVPMTDGMRAELESYYKKRLDTVEKKLTDLGLTLDRVPA